MKKIYSPLYIIATTILLIITPHTLCMYAKKALAIRMTSAEFSEINKLKSALVYNQYLYLQKLIAVNQVEACISGLKQISLDQEEIRSLFLYAANYKREALCAFFIEKYKMIIKASLIKQAGTTYNPSLSTLKYRDQYYPQTFDTGTSTNILTKREKH